MGIGLRFPLHAGSFAAAVLFLLGLGLTSTSCSATPEREREPVVLYPSPPAPPRVQFLKSISQDEDLGQEQSSLDSLLFGEERISKVIKTAYGSAVHDGKVFICDPRLGGVVVIDLAAKTMDVLATSGRGALASPMNLCFASDGRLYVADSVRGQIVVFDSQLRYENEFGPFGPESRPVDVDVAGDRLYVIDILTKLVHVLDRKTGKELFSFGQRQVSEEILIAPTNLALDDANNVYVVDTIRCEVIVFDSEGVYVRTIGALGDGAGAFARPKGIAIDGEFIYVVDAAFANCQILNMDGMPLMFFGGGGNGPGQMYLPSTVWVGEEGLRYFEDDLEDTFEAQRLIIVTNQYGPRKVNFYALGKDTRFDYEAYEAESLRKLEQAKEDALNAAEDE